MRNLRLQFILSHILPVIITIPLIALALNYAMETHFLLRDMKKTIQDQAAMIAQYSESKPEIWADSTAAEKMIQEIRPQLMSGIVLFDNAWNILTNYSGVATNQELIQKITPLKSMANTLLEFDPILNISFYNPFRGSDDIIEMMVPVSNSQNQLLGVVRLNFPVTYFEEQLRQTSGRVFLILIGGILLGAMIGMINAIGLERKLATTTTAIRDLSTGISNQPLPETGPEEIRQLSIAFNSLAAALEQSERSRTRMVSYLTHELGRPLGSLSSAVDALQMGATSDETLSKDLTTGMKNEIKRLELLVGDLSLLREKNDPINVYLMKPVALSSWLMDIYRYWTEVARGKDVILNEQIAPDLPTIQMDENRFYQAIGNLLSNAIKYSVKGSTVTFCAAQNEHEICISVQDNGSGILPEDLPHIFDSFYRGAEKKRFVQGMGLGLTISKDVVEAHHGNITVESKWGEGSTFVIHLPKKLIADNATLS